MVPRYDTSVEPFTSVIDITDLERLRLLEDNLRWLATWTVQYANYFRDNHEGLKAGGHQESSASVVSLLTALYFYSLRPEDRAAVKP